jgi:ArsR family transcriptional regulator
MTACWHKALTIVDTGTKVTVMSSAGTCCRTVRGRRLRQFDRHADIALSFKALGDPTRLAMLQMILEREELCACEIEPSFDLSQPTISHHLKQLREAGLITGERRGTWIYYSADRQAIGALKEHPIFSPG